MENKRISASEANKISSSVIPDIEKILNIIFGEIQLRAGLGQTSFSWPVHESILEQVLVALREQNYKVKSSRASDKKKAIVEIGW